MNWSFIKTFYCLNLRPNEQRWRDSVTQFLTVGIPWVFREVKDEPDDNRYLGFNRSMYETIRKGYETGETFCIFEDDVVFTPQFRVAEGAMQELPADFDLFYLGGNIIGSDVTGWAWPNKYSHHLAQLTNAWQTHAVVYSNKAAKYVLDNFDPETFPVLDEWLRVNVMPMGKSFVCKPMIAYQRPGWSDIGKCQVEYGCHEPGNIYLNRL